MPRSFRFLTPALAGLAFALLLAGCGDADAPEAGTPAETAGRTLPVEVIPVEPTTFERTLQTTGTIEAPDDATLSAEAAGTLRTLVPLGTAVARGQVVAQVDASLAQAQLAQAEAQREAARAQLALAEDQFRRQEQLFQDEIISALEFENVRSQQASGRAQLAQTEAAVAQAQEQVRRTRIVAPFSGFVEEHLAERGEQVNPGSPVVRVVGSRTVRARTGVPERYAGQVRIGTPVLIAPQAAGMAPRRATVSFVGQAVNPDTRTFPIEVQLDNPDGTLKPQMIVRATITLDTLDDVLTVPLAAVVRDESGATLVVADERDGRATARVVPVRLGPSADGRVVVEDGLTPGALVVIEGQTTLGDGDGIEVVRRHAAFARVALTDQP